MGKRGPTKANKTTSSTPNDVVMTPTWVAEWGIKHFNPKGIILEPCRGTGSFYNAFPQTEDLRWCEISEGKDFLQYNERVDWIITNPPFSIYDVFLLKSFELADNVVFLCPLAKAFKSMKIDKEIEKFGGLKEVVAFGGGGRVGFPFGFPVGFLHYQRGWTGPITYTRNYEK